MPKICYQETKFRESYKLPMIAQVNKIIREFKAQGYELTLRQVYYQFVSKDLLPQNWADKATGSTNNERSYKNLGELISAGRMSGLIDWHSIEDRTRELAGNAHWGEPGDIIESASSSFRIDKWEEQPKRIEVWVEKDALEGVVAKACRALDIDYFSCRGYTSQTAMWDASQRLKDYIDNEQNVLILHLGDHDPSGLDMSRDIEDRLRLFMGEDTEDNFEVRRIALNMEQIRLYNPPPNPAKITDTRAAKYIQEYGPESWELDALEPSVIAALIKDNVLQEREEDLFLDAYLKETRYKKQLRSVVENWGAVADFVEGLSVSEDNSLDDTEDED